MDAPFPWLAIALGVIAIGLAAVALMVFFRAKTTAAVTAAERAELAAAPRTPLQKIAWAGLLVGVVQCLAIGAVFATQGGAVEYWENDGMRHLVAALFVLGLVVSAVLSGLAQFKADERERAVLSWGPRVQSAAVLITLALGIIFLAERFREQGAIPVVYAYLGFGSVFIVHMTTNFLGILLGYRATRFDGQG